MTIEDKYRDIVVSIRTTALNSLHEDIQYMDVKLLELIKDSITANINKLIELKKDYKG